MPDENGGTLADAIGGGFYRGRTHYSSLYRGTSPKKESREKELEDRIAALEQQVKNKDRAIDRVNQARHDLLTRLRLRENPSEMEQENNRLQKENERLSARNGVLLRESEALADQLKYQREVNAKLRSDLAEARRRSTINSFGWGWGGNGLTPQQKEDLDSLSELRKNYKKIMRVVHPDKHGNSDNSVHVSQLVNSILKPK